MDEEEPTKLDKFDQAVEAAEKPFFALFQKTEKNAHRITILSIIFVFDLLMFLGFGFVALRADHAVDEALKVKKAQLLSQCESGNDFRKLDLQRWTYVLEISSKPDPSETPAQRAKSVREAQLFRKYIEEADKQRNCEKYVKEQLELNNK